MDHVKTKSPHLSRFLAPSVTSFCLIDLLHDVTLHEAVRLSFITMLFLFHFAISFCMPCIHRPVYIITYQIAFVYLCLFGNLLPLGDSLYITLSITFQFFRYSFCQSHPSSCNHIGCTHMYIHSHTATIF